MRTKRNAHTSLFDLERVFDEWGYIRPLKRLIRAQKRLNSCLEAALSDSIFANDWRYAKKCKTCPPKNTALITNAEKPKDESAVTPANSQLAQATQPAQNAAPQISSPAFEITKTGEGILNVRAALPQGMTKDSIDVEVLDGVLTVRGHKKEEQRTNEDQGEFYSKTEWHFTRSFTLPEGVSPKDITATFNNGVLELKVPAPQAPVKSSPVPIAIS